jgi:hypothetical protein
VHALKGTTKIWGVGDLYHESWLLMLSMLVVQVVQKVLNRELQPWETIAIGGLSGGLAAIATTPFDVMKTRTMTAAPGMPSTMGTIMVAIVKDEGLLALFKGAIPRFFWIAPLGAMNFAGYELAKRAMENKEKEVQGVGEQEKSR